MSPREALLHAIEHFEHILPAQAPIRDFVHHNTLHGFQHLGFPEALASAREVNGAYGYQGSDDYRRYYAEGRITHEDLAAVLAEDERFDSESPVIEGDELHLTQADILISAMSHAIKPVTNCQLTWQVEEQGALNRFRDGVAYEGRKRILESSRKSEAEAVSELWQSSLQRLGLQHFLLRGQAAG
jgi:hypothetical protein